MLNALRRHRDRRRRARQAASGPAPADPLGERAEAVDPCDAAGPAHDDTPLAELLLTDVVDPLEASIDVDFAAIPGVREAPLRVSAHTPVPRALPPIEDARERIAHAAIFGSLAIDTLEALKQQVRVQLVPEGSLVFREGEASDALYIVARGAVVPETGAAPAVRLSVLGDGECFGEVGLLTGGLRSTSVRALVDTELLVLDREFFAWLIERDPTLLSALSERLRERIVDRLLKTSPLFASLDCAERSELIREFRLIEVENQCELVEQGTPAPGLFVILSGAVRVLHCGDAGDKELALLGAGGFFGEMSLLENAPAVASVAALSPCWMLALPRSRFERLLARDPTLARHVNGVALMRHHQNHLALREATPAHGRVELF